MSNDHHVTVVGQIRLKLTSLCRPTWLAHNFHVINNGYYVTDDVTGNSQMLFLGDNARTFWFYSKDNAMEWSGVPHVGITVAGLVSCNSYVWNVSNTAQKCLHFVD